jgi:hypothetical protein
MTWHYIFAKNSHRLLKYQRLTAHIHPATVEDQSGANLPRRPLCAGTVRDPNPTLRINPALYALQSYRVSHHKMSARLAELGVTILASSSHALGKLSRRQEREVAKVVKISGAPWPISGLQRPPAPARYTIRMAPPKRGQGLDESLPSVTRSAPLRRRCPR